jgi:hypothetical protein
MILAKGSAQRLELASLHRSRPSRVHEMAAHPERAFQRVRTLGATRRGGVRTTPCDGLLCPFRLYAEHVRGATHEDHLREFRHDGEA